MGVEYFYINFDTRETGVRYSKFGEDTLDPTGRLAKLLLHPGITRKLPIPPEWLPKCSEERRRTLGKFSTVPWEIINAILTYLTDYISVACLGATHPLMVLPAFERMRDISVTLAELNQWASDRITLMGSWSNSSALPSHVLTECEKREMTEAEADVDADRVALWSEWPTVKRNFNAPNHGDELRARRSDSSQTFDREAHARWASDYSGYRSAKARKRRQISDEDFKRVWTFLDRVEGKRFWQLEAGEYVICNESKHEYVTAEDIARFVERGLKRKGEEDEGGNSDVEVFGHWIISDSSWGMGDTAGFLVTCDEGDHVGVGMGRWVGDRICITTARHMRSMKDANGERFVWTDIGGEDGDLWERIEKPMSVDGIYKDWLKKY